MSINQSFFINALIIPMRFSSSEIKYKRLSSKDCKEELKISSFSEELTHCRKPQQDQLDKLFSSSFFLAQI